MQKTISRTTLRGTLIAATLALMPCAAFPAGLGKLTVFSGIGQPLRAEVELNATRDELSSLSAKLASPDAFKSAGIEYSPALSGIRFSVDKRSDGRPVLKLSSDRPMSEPFVDLLVELNWATGRLAREYTFLLDPVDAPSTSSSGVVALPSTKSEVIAEPQVPPSSTIAERAPVPVVVTPPPSEPVVVSRSESAPAVAVPEPRPAPVPARSSVPKAQRQASAPAGGVAGQYLVKPGDTLRQVARETQPEDVSLDQMLVALYRGNTSAFVGRNMNRLITGKMLNVPDRDKVVATSPSEAKRIVVAQTSDWSGYRRKLATVAATSGAKAGAVASRDAGGKVTAKVADKTARPAPTRDELKVSKSETSKAAKAAPKDGPNRVAALEEDLVAKDKALKEAQSRVVDLEKNVKDLEGLVKLKNEQLAKLESQAGAKVVPPGKEAEAKPAEPVKEKPAEPAKAQPGADVALKPSAPPADVAKAEKAPDTPKPAVNEPGAEEPSFLDDLLENPTSLAGGAGALALLLGGYAWYKTRRKRDEEAGGPETLSGGEHSLAANSVFGDTGGRSVDTSTGGSIQSGFTEASMGAMEADEVDPVAEADVYIAYGRDAQAEEILLEAMQKDPSRHAIQLKLLEIYSARKNVKQFEGIASDLYSRTGGSGPDWERTVAMGLQVDPTNPLYGGQAPVAQASPPVVEAPSPKETWTMPGTLQVQDVQPAVTPDSPKSSFSTAGVAAAATGLGATLAAAGAAAAAKAKATVKEFPGVDLDFSDEPATGNHAVVEPLRDLDKTQVDGGFVRGAVDEKPLDFEFNLDEPAPAAHVAGSREPAIDLSDIRLDLDEPSVAPGDSPEVTTKLELARAYEEMGDKEGARELLQEVLKEGSASQKDRARSLLNTLG